MSGRVCAKSDSCSTHMLIKLVAALTALSAIGIGLWQWIQQHQDALPPPDSKQGRTLLRQYQQITHEIWLILLLLALGYLIYQIYKNKHKEQLSKRDKNSQTVGNILQFVKKNPITTILLMVYTIGMISGTTYLYKDMTGWYPDLVKGHFLENFSIRQSFVDETMRRSDYRFFPLAHQDLHILSWFTIHIKTWMLLSAAELISIVALTIKFLNGLQAGKPAQQSAILLITCLFLIHPSTGTAFFHVIYCERLLCLIFMLYITSYLDYRNTRKSSSKLLTILWALLGIYIKDIAIVLFIIPAGSLWLADKIYKHKDDQKIVSRKEVPQDNKLEQWLVSLILIFTTSYIYLALIPSGYAAEGAYNEDTAHKIILDFRVYVFAMIALTRVAIILKDKTRFNLLDGINAAGFAYAAALGLTYKFNATSYLAVPFQLIATINIGWLWIQAIERNNRLKNKPMITLTGAALTSVLILGIDHTTTANTFSNKLSEQKLEQANIQTTYEKLYKVSLKIRETGDDVNIIIHQDSRLSSERHLNRIPYKSLIEYEPIRAEFIVKDGAGKGKIYTPKKGDLIANLDRDIDVLVPILKNMETKIIYRHNPTQRSGLILRITEINS